MLDQIDYASPGPLTDLDGVDPQALAPLPVDPVDICWPVHGLVVQPDHARELGLSADRLAYNDVRSARGLVEALLAHDPAPVTVLRPPRSRVVGTCRHFAVLACALLRHRSVPARVRCGFATYFVAGKGLDHWIVEYWHADEQRWVRLDPELLDADVLQDPQDLQVGEFLTGGEAWVAWRRGQLDAAAFGVPGTANWGPSEIRGNLVRDLAALNKLEMLPWDEWGQMEAAYRGATGPDYDALLDTAADVCATAEGHAVIDVSAHPDLAVPPVLVN